MSHPHLDRLHELPCVVSYILLNRIIRPVVVHHLESTRDELSHYGGVPMTDYWHKTLHNASRRGFERQTKLNPLDMLEGTIKLLMGD